MDRTKPILGLCMFCAVALSALAAQSASAAVKGTTAFTCVKGKGTLHGEHCLEEGSQPAEYGHVAIPQDTTTEGISTNEGTASETTAASVGRLKMTVAGVATELITTVAEGEGWMENKVDPTGEHYIYGEGVTTYRNVQVAKPAGKGCKVYTDNGGAKGEEGVVHTERLKGTSTGMGDSGRLEPAEGTVLARFILEGCEGEALKNLNQTYTVEGSITCPVHGSTVSCSHTAVTEAGTLLINGSIRAGIEIGTTAKAREKGSFGAYRPLSATTVET